MSGIKRLFLIIEYLENPNEYAFENEMEKSIIERKSVSDVVLTMDNFSDGITTGQVITLLKEYEAIILINHFKSENVLLGKATAVLNLGIRRKATLYSNMEIRQIKPMMTHAKGKYYDSATELAQLLFE